MPRRIYLGDREARTVDHIKGREENRRLFPFPVVLVTSQAFPFLMMTMLALSSISQSTFISCKIVPVKCHANYEIN